MCMKFTNVFQKFPRWALSKKTVYKVMRKSKDPTACYSVHRDHRYILGKMQGADIRIDYNGHVADGLHAFPYLSDAMDELLRHRKDEYFYPHERPVSHYAIYECEIPRFAKFFCGIWEYYWPTQIIPNIVSDRLTITKEIVLESDVAKLEEWDKKKAERTREYVDDEVPLDTPEY